MFVHGEMFTNQQTIAKLVRNNGFSWTNALGSMSGQNMQNLEMFQGCIVSKNIILTVKFQGDNLENEQTTTGCPHYVSIFRSCFGPITMCTANRFAYFFVAKGLHQQSCSHVFVFFGRFRCVRFGII